MSAIYPQFAAICQGCQKRPTCPVSVNPTECADLDADDRAYHERVDDEALEFRYEMPQGEAR